MVWNLSDLSLPLDSHLMHTAGGPFIQSMGHVLILCGCLGPAYGLLCLRSFPLPRLAKVELQEAQLGLRKTVHLPKSAQRHSVPTDESPAGESPESPKHIQIQLDSAGHYHTG